MATTFRPGSGTSTFLGGQPRARRDYPWPSVDGSELGFVLQLDLADVDEPRLPNEGRLHLFANLFDEPSWHLHFDAGPSAALVEVFPRGELIEEHPFERTDLVAGIDGALLHVGGAPSLRDGRPEDVLLWARLGAHGLDPYGDWSETDPEYARVLARGEEWWLILQADIADDLGGVTRVFLVGEASETREGRFERARLEVELDPKYD